MDGAGTGLVLRAASSGLKRGTAGLERQREDDRKTREREVRTWWVLEGPPSLIRPEGSVDFAEPHAYLQSAAEAQGQSLRAWSRGVVEHSRNRA